MLQTGQMQLTRVTTSSFGAVVDGTSESEVEGKGLTVLAFFVGGATWSATTGIHTGLAWWYSAGEGARLGVS